MFTLIQLFQCWRHLKYFLFRWIAIDFKSVSFNFFKSYIFQKELLSNNQTNLKLVTFDIRKEVMDKPNVQFV